MGRMLRRLFILSAAVSLLLFVAVMVLWVRSDGGRDDIDFKWRGRTYAIASEAGRIGIGNRPQLYDFSQWQLQRAREIGRKLDRLQASVQAGSAPANQADEIKRLDREETAVLTRPMPVTVQYRIHYIWLAALSCVLPARWLWYWHRRQVYAAGGRCLSYGYDVRASPDRCPECGISVHPEIGPTPSVR